MVMPFVAVTTRLLIVSPSGATFQSKVERVSSALASLPEQSSSTPFSGMSRAPGLIALLLSFAVRRRVDPVAVDVGRVPVAVLVDRVAAHLRDAGLATRVVVVAVRRDVDAVVVLVGGVPVAVLVDRVAGGVDRPRMDRRVVGCAVGAVRGASPS